MPRTSKLPLNLHPNLHAALAQNYPTVESFLLAQEFVPVPEDTDDYQFSHQAEEALLDCIKLTLAPQPINGVTLLEKVTASRNLSTGCSSLDELLGGGIREGLLTELAGYTATGKTQICLQLAAIAAWREERVVYIDTGRAFSAQRMVAMAKATSPDKFSPAAESLTSYLKNVDLLECHDQQSLILILGKLQNDLHSNDREKRTSLLVVDSIAALIPATLGLKNSMQGHTLMIQAAILLKQIADRHKMAVVVTNSLVAGQTETFKPAMGESWRNQPHVRLILTRQDGEADGPKRRATLAASQTEVTNSHTDFTITQQGVLTASSLM